MFCPYNMFSLETIQTESSITRLQIAGVKYIEQDSFARYTKTNDICF
jgi:hypothetical protein